MREQVIAALKTVRDPEIPVNIYDLGLIYDLEIAESGEVDVRMTLTTPNCPVAEAIPAQVQQTVAAVPGVTDVRVELVWEPAWTPQRMSEAAQFEMAAMGLDFLGGGGPRPMVSADELFNKRKPPA